MAKLERDHFEVGDDVEIVNDQPLKGNSVSPPVTMGGKHKVKDITLDKEGNQHLDLGLESDYSYITSYETGEELPNGDTVHWCHPSRCKKL